MPTSTRTGCSSGLFGGFWREDIFVNEMWTIVRKKKVIQLVVNEGWYAPKEVKDDLKWTQILVLTRLQRFSTEEAD